MSWQPEEEFGRVRTLVHRNVRVRVDDAVIARLAATRNNHELRQELAQLVPDEQRPALLRALGTTDLDDIRSLIA